MSDIINMERLGFGDLLGQDYQALFEEVTLSEIGLCLTITILLAAFIFIVYRLNYRGSMYSYSFNASLVGLCLITSIMMMAISSNIVLSLGMVGALSIVRFRTPLKDPGDTVYVYWAICAGITAGVGIYGIALLGNLVIGVVVTIFTRIRLSSKRYLLVIKVSKAAMEETEKQLNKPFIFMKSKYLHVDNVEFNVVIKKEKALQAIASYLNQNDQIISFTQLSYEE